MNVDAGSIWTYIGAVALVLFGHQLQQGGLRRRRRRELREELELVALLDSDRHVDAAKRLHYRISQALEVYEPEPLSRIAKVELWSTRIAVSLTVIEAIVFAIAFDLSLTQPIKFLGFVIAGITLIEIQQSLARRLLRRLSGWPRRYGHPARRTPSP